MELTASATAARRHETIEPTTFMGRLNSTWHERAMQFFLFIVLAHWAEHLAQAFQIYALGWPIPASRGVLGLWFRGWSSPR